MGTLLSTKDINTSPVLADWGTSVKNSDLAVVRVPYSDLGALIEANLANPVVSGVLQVALGSAAAPAIRGAGDVNSGLYFHTTNSLAYTHNGEAHVNFDAIGINIKSDSYFGISPGDPAASAADVKLYRDGTNTFAQRNGAAAQELRVYNTWDTGGTNYERLKIAWESNVLAIGTEAGGTGSNRVISIKAGTALVLHARNGGNLRLGSDDTTRWTIEATTGTLQPLTNNGNDIGQASKAIKEIFIGETMNVVSKTVNTTAIDVSAFSLTGASAVSMIDLTGTWNTTGAATAIKLNIVNTASDATSLLMDLKVGGISQFNVDAFGAITVRTNIQDAGAANYYLSNAGVSVGSDEGYYFSSTGAADGASDVALLRDAADTLALRRGANDQSLNIYGTFTDAGNYERGEVGWNGNVFEIGMSSAGTGTDRVVRLISPTTLTIAGGSSAGISFKLGGTAKWAIVGTTGHLQPQLDNDVNFGAAAKRIKNLFVAGKIDSVQAAANLATFVATGYSLTGADATSMIDLAGTWNTTGAPTAILLDMLDTASDAASLLMDLKVGGSSKFTVEKTGEFGQGTATMQAQSGNGFEFKPAGVLRVGMNANGNLVTRNIIGLAIDHFGFSNLSTTAVSNTADTRLYRDAAYIFAQRNGTNAQKLSIYKTWTDAGNYERGILSWQDETDIFEIGTEDAGTGSARSLLFSTSGVGRWQINQSGHLFPFADNSYDLGKDTNRTRDIWLAGSVLSSKNQGTPGTGVTAVEIGDGFNKTTRLTFSGTSVLPAITGGAPQAVGFLAYTFPNGVTRVKSIHMDVGIDGAETNIDADTPDVGVGSAIATGANALLSDFGATGEDYVTGSAAANCTGTNTDLSEDTQGAGLKLNIAGGVKTLHFNAADNWAASGDTGPVLSGTITIEWTFLGA